MYLYMELFKRTFYNDNNELQLFEKLSYFSQYTFYEDTHTYRFNDQRVAKSVTGLVSEFVEPFDEKKWLPRKAKECGISEEELKAEWQHKADVSAATGTLFHKFMEMNMTGKTFCPVSDIIRDDLRDEVITRYNGLIKHGYKFVDDVRGNLIPVKNEFTVGWGTSLAGQIDQLAYNKETKQLEIYDWKTNKDISCWSTWHRKMLGPFSSLDECELNSYSLQLSLYKALLQRQGINIGNMFLVWFNENNKSYMLFPCKDLTKAADKLIA